MLSARDKRTAGYTLTELMVVVVLIGLAMAATVPNFTNSIRATRSERATAELQSDLRWAISNARANGRPLQLVFSLDGYSLRDAVDSTRVLRSRSYGNAARFNAGADPMIFPWGMVQPTVVAVDGATGIRQMDLLPTGRLKFQSQGGTP